METSIFLARLIGPLFLLVAAGVLMNPKHYANMTSRFIKNPELYYFSGAMAFVIGVAMVIVHNVWTTDWRVVITILGWLSIFKGVIRILCPNLGATIANSLVESKQTMKISSIILILFGAWLSFQGYLTDIQL